MEKPLPQVVFYEVFEEEKEALQKFLPGNITARFISRTIQEYREPQAPAKPEAGLISVRTQSQIPVEWAPHLAGIFTRSQGHDHLSRYCRTVGRNIPCGYIREYCSRAVAEHAIMVTMVLLRKLKKQMISFEAFSRDGLTGLECCGRRALVIGVGQIGTQLVDLALALGMTVKGVDPRDVHKDLEYISLKDGLVWADVIFCACPLTEKTRGMLDYARLCQARRGSIFINIARGEIAPLADLERLLSEGVLGGISLDVFEDESALAESLRARRRNEKNAAVVFRLKDRDDVLLTPHNAFNTREALETKARLSAEAIEQFLRKGAFPHAVPV